MPKLMQVFVFIVTTGASLSSTFANSAIVDLKSELKTCEEQIRDAQKGMQHFSKRFPYSDADQVLQILDCGPNSSKSKKECTAMSKKVDLMLEMKILGADENTFITKMNSLSSCKEVKAYFSSLEQAVD